MQHWQYIKLNKYLEKTFITRIKYLLRGENIYYAEKIFITRKKYLLRRENIYYAEEIFITRRKYSPDNYLI